MWSLIHTVPNRSALATRRARPMSRVHTDDARPYGVPLPQAIAWSSSVNCWTAMTGPKISRWTTSWACWGAATAAGSAKEPGHDGRLEEEARQVGLVAARHDLRVRRRPLEEALDALALARRVERPEV